MQIRLAAVPNCYDFLGRFGPQSGGFLTAYILSAPVRAGLGILSVTIRAGIRIMTVSMMPPAMAMA